MPDTTRTPWLLALAVASFLWHGSNCTEVHFSDVSRATAHQPPPCEVASECMLTARLRSA